MRIFKDKEWTVPLLPIKCPLCGNDITKKKYYIKVKGPTKKEWMYVSEGKRFKRKTANIKMKKNDKWHITKTYDMIRAYICKECVVLEKI